MTLKKFFSACFTETKRALSFSVFALLFSHSMRAGNEKMNARITASQIQTGAFVSVADSKYPDVALSGSAAVKNSTARITLGLDNYITGLNYFGMSAMYLKVGLQVTYTDINGAVHAQFQDLVIDYKNSGRSTDKSSVVIQGAHAVSAAIVYFKDNTGTITSLLPFIPSNLYLEAEIETERYYAMLASDKPVLNHYYYSNSDELMVYWSSVYGAEEYELEYTFVNTISPASTPYDYSTGAAASINTLPNNVLSFSFNKNATRIRTAANTFRISMNYEEGLLFYRVRAIGRDLSNTDYEAIGDWTLDQPQMLLSIPFTSLPGGFNDFYTITTGHEENKNWQASASFTEDGKKKDVISYFDGTSRKRQTVTRNNSDYLSLAAETLYDSQGRPAINALPSPAFDYSLHSYSSQLHFFENLNQSSTQGLAGGYHVPFNRIDFETNPVTSCPSASGGMYTGVSASSPNGASLYYSANNPNQENQNSYLPDAEKYPFVQTVYTPDHTDRVKYQGGAGKQLGIGSGHETKYLYGDPDQEDLDKLFGSEAGYAEKYRKNMVVDPNGQISVSYLNSENKVVATALAGSTPTNVNAVSGLSTYAKAVSYLNYHDSNYTTINKADNGALTFKKKIIPDLTGTYNFFYSITVPQYSSSCIPSFCYDCAYNLEIKIQDECNTVVYSTSNSVGIPINYTCGASVYFSTTGISPAFNVNLTAGKEYLLTKVLTIDAASESAYLDHYLAHADTIACARSLSSFQATELAAITTTDCGMTCLQCSLAVESYWSNHNNASLANDPDYIYMSPAQKQLAIDQCMRSCLPVTLCQAQFENMLQDLRPTGQYAQYSVTPANDYDGSSYELSVFNDDNYLRLSTIYGGPTSGNGTPFTTYDISTLSHWRKPEYYKADVHSFASPDPGVSQYHYFNADGTVSRARLVQLANGGFYPEVVVSATLSVLSVEGVYSDAQGYWTMPENLKYLKDFVLLYANNPSWAYSLVKNHPEFNYFLDCDRQSNTSYYTSITSEGFDNLLRTAENYSDAYGLTGTINAGQTNFTLLASDNVSDLIGSDPYFNGSGPGASSYSAFYNRLNNYEGSGSTLKKICAQLYSSAQMYYSGCASAATFGAASIVCNSVSYSISTSAMDAIWLSYRDMYLDEKQKFILEQAHQAACNPGSNQNNYYNGAIGDQNFTPWSSYTAYGFQPFFIPTGLTPFFGSYPFNTLVGNLILNAPDLWPNYPLSVTGFLSTLFHPAYGTGYFDFGSPSSFYHKGRYANKTRRVPDLQTLSNYLAGGASGNTDLETNLQQSMEADSYFATGQCPTYKRLELFLAKLAQEGKLAPNATGSVVPLVPEPAFTQDLYDAILNCAGYTASTWHPLGIVTATAGNVLTLHFYDMNSSTVLSGANIVLNNISGTTITNWNSVNLFSGIFYNGVTSTNNFIIKALYTDPSTLSADQLMFSGTTCIASNCPTLSALVNGQLCTPTQQALELQSFLSAVVNDYTVSGMSTPLNLGNIGGNNSSSYFTALVRYPFTSAAVLASPVTHSVQIFSGFTTIEMRGRDASSNPVTVDFVFTPSSSGPSNLSGAVSFSDIDPNPTNSLIYDFTIKAHYTSGAVQTFSVKINYSNSCGSAYSNSCRTYQLKTCEQYVPVQCQGNNTYKNTVQLNALLNELMAYPQASLYPVNNLANFSTLLQSSFGGATGQFSINSTHAAALSPGYFTHTVTISFVDLLANPLCNITFSVTDQLNTATFNNSLPDWVFLGIVPLGDLPSATFSAAIQASGLSSEELIYGSSGYVLLGTCEPCGNTDTVLVETFRQYNAGTTTSAMLNFDAQYLDPAISPGPLPCYYAGFNTCPPVTFGSYAIMPNSNPCYTNYPSPGSDNFLFSQITYLSPGATSAYLIPWKTRTPIATTIGSKYDISFYFYSYSLDLLHLDLVVNDGTNDVVISSLTINNCWTGPASWTRIQGSYFATGSSMDVKIKLTPVYNTCYNPGPYANVSMYKNVGIDDILILQKSCDNNDNFPVAVSTSSNDCANQLINIAYSNAQQKYDSYLNDLKNGFKKAYTDQCYQTLETFTTSYSSSEGFYTLYYYDQAGNLIRTIPPEGAAPLVLTGSDPLTGKSYGAEIKSDRDNGTHTTYTKHRMATRYEYNSLNQLVRQQMPDHANPDLFATTALPAVPANAEVFDMDFSDPLHGYLVGYDNSGPALYMTSDGGNTWHPPSAIGSADIVDIDYTGISTTTAVAITSDGDILRYNAASHTWNMVNLTGSSTLQFTDIEFIPGTLTGVITGKNGLVMVTGDGGLTWTTVNIGTLNNLNKVDYNGSYGVIAGDNGTVYYTPYASNAYLWQAFTSMNGSIDLLNVQLINPTASALTAIATGVDRNVTPASGTVLELANMDGGFPIITNRYLHSSANSSKIDALAVNIYQSSPGPNTCIDLFFGGVENAAAPTPVFHQLASVSPIVGSPSYTDMPLTLTGTIAGITDLTLDVNAGTNLAKVLGVTSSGNFLILNHGNTTATVSGISIGGTPIAASCNRIVNNSATSGLIAADNGNIISYTTTAPSFTTMSGITLPPLTAISAAKDGSGNVYAVTGASNKIAYSNDNGNTWHIATLSIFPAPQINAVKYVAGTPAKVILAGSNGYLAKINVAGSPVATLLTGTLSGRTFNSIATPFNDNNKLFLAGGDNSNHSLIMAYSFSTAALSSVYTGTASNHSLRKIVVSNSNITYAVGDLGTILTSSINGGPFSAHTPTTSNLIDVVIRNQLTAYAFSAGNTLLKTTDGGVTWASKTLPANYINTAYDFGNGSILVGSSDTDNLFTINDQSGDVSSRFFYDALGRLIISQNAKQAVHKAYSYTVYDALGRIMQVGEIDGTGMADPGTLTGSTSGVIPLTSYTSWLATGGAKSQVTTTLYDDAAIYTGCTFSQDNLRKRVSATYLDDDASLANGYVHAAFYSYDIHGNVKALLQENPAMSADACKRMDYTYDLISGKVNSVSYQAGKADAFYHRYEYDADNRLTTVYTSKDGVEWSRDAKYFYYLHGPLARAEVGNEKVQGMDYAYTLQGWIKGINSAILDAGNDIGKDGQGGSNYNSAVSDMHRYIAYDAAAYALHYYEKKNTYSDYTAINSAKNTATNRFDAYIPDYGYFTAGNNSLFNGNIVSMASNMYTLQPDPSADRRSPLLASYRYDQLNRLLRASYSNSISSNAWSGSPGATFYDNEFTYDNNGNIVTQHKYDNQSALIDNLTYIYPLDGTGHKLANRLDHVADAAGLVHTYDLPNQTTGNYTYDEIGDLTKDNSETIAGIDWTVYGKIKTITRSGTSRQNLTFAYNAAGNRISKHAFDNGSYNSTTDVTTYYVRDAQGNVMAAYDYKEDPANPGSNNLQMTLREQYIYGSSRLGVRTYPADWNNITGNSPYITSSSIYNLPLKQGDINYELTNHLGNVISVVSDRKLPVDNGSGSVDHFLPELLSSTDYYPFGQMMPGRQFNNGNYRFGFNGQEKDDEIKGSGNSMTAEYWEYDTRLGRRWNIDPVMKPWMSPYHAFSNKPIWNIDPNGATDGDYYDKDGKHLGSDGKDDNKVYAADNVTKNDKGIVTSVTNAQDLGVTHTDFQISANVVKHESSGDKTESLWIAHAANNAKDNDAIDWQKENTSLKDQLTDAGYSTTPPEARTALSVSDNSESANNARAAVLNVHTGGADPTGGAVLWDGTDFLAKGSKHNKFNEYNNVKIGATDMWNFYLGVGAANKKYSVDIKTFFRPIVFSEALNQKGNSKRTFNLESTGAQGSSIFWKIQKK